MTIIRIGADPELFIRDTKTGNFVSAHTLLPGTKIEPFKVPMGAIQVDGTAAEFNIDPATDANHFLTNISTVISQLQARISGTGLELVYDPTATYDPVYFAQLPDHVKELGCNPDFNAWTGRVNPSPDSETGTMRTAAGHIHIGWIDKGDIDPHDPAHFEDCCAVTKQLDYYLGLYSLLWDRDPKRRSLYGKAGAFRPKPYGVEYRVLSNAWLRSTKVQQWVFNAAVFAVGQLLRGTSIEEKFEDFAQTAIDGNESWWQTDKGKSIHSWIGMEWPDYKSCMSKDEFAELEHRAQEQLKKQQETIGKISDIMMEGKPKNKNKAMHHYN